MTIGAAALLLAAAAGTFIAVIGFIGLCDGDSNGCPDGDPSAELVWQLVLGIVGLPVAAAMTWAAVHERLRLAAALLALALLIYAAWAVLLDIATHGEFTLLPELLLVAVVGGCAAVIRRRAARRATPGD